MRSAFLTALGIVRRLPKGKRPPLFRNSLACTRHTCYNQRNILQIQQRQDDIDFSAATTRPHMACFVHLRYYRTD